MENKRDLLVTLADRNYIKQAKQLFSSVYWNAGWEGDYMLLAHDIPDEELQWFIDKGIFITNCKDHFTGLIIHDQHSPVILDKLYIFTPEFRKWKNIIYLDSDMIVKGSLEALTRIKGFSAVSPDIKLSMQLNAHGNLYNEIKNRYNLNKKSFNTGLLAFSTNIIQDNLLDTFTELFNYYGNTLRCNEESVLNLFFYNKWIKLPRAYNFYISYLLLSKIRYKNIKAIILHFIHLTVPNNANYKPWNPESPFYSEWISNLERSELMDLNIVQKVKKWNTFKIKYYSLIIHVLYKYHKLKTSLFRYKLESFFRYKLKFFVIYIIKTPDRLIGRFGVFLKKLNPDLYYKLRKIKDGK